ncbi:hypothetical protein [Olivibacter domesticus]|uniref:Zinc-ribbon 15 domain-containing protein n=1 Tax=Olivibacter domesticus TaxID=407022 RepID=A0A1H7W959_OLID1|nr:hypothetical protein [Olivibacter domesticus]SEM18021.1 hypothetical protein SAMN05661044_04473 [Olivibacter domesticus]
MIIFGSRTNAVGQGTPTYRCNYCGTEDSVFIQYFLRYFHVFWIPMFPYRTYGTSCCAHCRQVLSRREMSTELKSVVSSEKPRPSIKYFSGLLLLVVGIIFIAIAIQTEIKQTETFLAKPQLGDVYGIKQENGAYTLYLLTKQQHDSLGFRLNDYEVSTSSQLSKLRNHHSTDYGKDLYYYSKEELEQWLNEKIIVNIKRE